MSISSPVLTQEIICFSSHVDDLQQKLKQEQILANKNGRSILFYLLIGKTKNVKQIKFELENRNENPADK